MRINSDSLSQELKAFEVRYSFGEKPATRRKDLLNWDKDWKPASNAISEILRLGFSSRFLGASRSVRKGEQDLWILTVADQPNHFHLS